LYDGGNAPNTEEPPVAVSSEFLKETVERAAKTFVEAFAATWALSQPLDYNIATVKVAVVAAAAAGGSAVVSFLSARFGSKKNDPSLV
jgi:r1t holin